MKTPSLTLHSLLRTVFSVLLIVLFSSCSQIGQFGPVNLAEIQRAQKNGNANNKYKIIDITSSNMRVYNHPEPRITYETPPFDASKAYSDEILPHDKLTLQVVDDGNLGQIQSSTYGPIEVPKNGVISFPYAVENEEEEGIQVIGKSIQSVEKEIRVTYASRFPTAEIILSRNGRKEKRANVIGLVRSAGQFPLNREGITIADLIALSGGTSQEPHVCLYLLHRGGRSYQLSNSQVTRRNIKAQDGDLLEVKLREDHSVTLMGSVKRPGNHNFPNSQSSLSDFLGSSSGLNLSTSDAQGVFVIRNTSDKYTNIYRFNLLEPEGLINSSKFYLHGGDIVYVTEAPLSRWNRALRNILPFGSSVSGVAGSAATGGAL